MEDQAARAIALWFHDAIYDLARHKNEAQSADWAVAELKHAGAADAVCTRVLQALVSRRFNKYTY